MVDKRHAGKSVGPSVELGRDVRVVELTEVLAEDGARDTGRVHDMLERLDRQVFLTTAVSVRINGQGRFPTSDCGRSCTIIGLSYRIGESRCLNSQACLRRDSGCAVALREAELPAAVVVVEGCVHLFRASIAKGGQYPPVRLDRLFRVGWIEDAQSLRGA